MWGPFYVDGPEPLCYTKACELVGKGVTSPLELYHRPACAQARHAQCWGSSGMVWQAGHNRYSHGRITITASTAKDTTTEWLL